MRHRSSLDAFSLRAPVVTVAVVGPGAVGGTIAACLHGAGRPVGLFGLRPRDDVDVRPDGEPPVLVPGPVHTDPAAVGATSELVFLAVNATQNAAAAAWLNALCAPGTVVCVLQNGVEQVATVGPLVPAATVVPAVVWFPAETQPEGWIRVRGEPRLTLPATTAAKVVEQALSSTACSVELAEDFTTAAWHKLLLNAGAGLMVLSRRRSGMFRRDDAARLAEGYLAECLVVARAEGADLPDDMPRRIVEQFRGYPEDLGTSILADSEAGRPLEWDQRNGVVRRLARVHGVATPISDVVVPLLAAASDGPG